MKTVNLPPIHGPARFDAIRQRMVAGTYDPIAFGPVPSSAQGPSGTKHTATFFVTRDAFKLDGVRIGLSPGGMQELCDLNSADESHPSMSLTTPRIMDLAFLARGTVQGASDPLTLAPSFPPEGPRGQQDTADWERHSDRIDTLIAQAGGPPGGSAILQTYGKTWARLKGLAASGKACNHGWQFVGPTFNGFHFDATTIPGLRAVQGLGTVHTLAEEEDDYSQTGFFLAEPCIVDGQSTTVRAVLLDPELAPLANHNGAFTVEDLRMRVPFFAAPSSGTSPSASSSMVHGSPPMIALRGAAPALAPSGASLYTFAIASDVPGVTLTGPAFLWDVVWTIGAMLNDTDTIRAPVSVAWSAFR